MEGMGGSAEEGKEVVARDLNGLASWPDKQTAAARIGISVKTLERMAAKGHIEQQMRPRVGASDMAVFNPRDVEKAASLRSKELVPAVSEPVPAGSELVPAIPEPVPATSNHFQPIVVQLLPPPPADPEPDLWTIDQAVARGYSRKIVQLWAREGMITRHGRRYSSFELRTMIGRK